jgi:hypothetical protein
MFKAIKLTGTRNDPSGVWPSEIGTPGLERTNTKQLLDVGMEVYVNDDYKNNVDTYLSDASSFEAYYVFPTEESYNTHKDLAYSILPPWKSFFESDAELESYHTMNNLVITLEEISNPDLSGLTKLILEVVDGQVVSYTYLDPQS